MAERFQSTLPVWGATIRVYRVRIWRRNFNPRSPCGERPGSHRHPGCSQSHFNPRSPCGERPWNHVIHGLFHTISIHAPRVGSDRPVSLGGINPPPFQSTLPVWGATEQAGSHDSQVQDFNPRSPCGERLVQSKSIDPAKTFQSTLPVWGATLLRFR